MKKQKRKFSRPLHPWEKLRMDNENKIIRRYGLIRKKEIWKTAFILRKFRSQARQLLAASGRQAELEKKQLLTRLNELGIVAENATLDDVLGLTIENFLERRLQTLVYKKNLAKTPQHARQLVTHGHIAIDGNCVSTPSYLVSTEEEKKISYVHNSPFSFKPVESPPTQVEGEKKEG